MTYTNTRSKKQLYSITGSKCQSHRSGDPNTAFHDLTPAEILHRFGMPKTLLSTSSKAAKCRKVGVLARVMYLTPGVFCPNATTGCLAELPRAFKRPDGLAHPRWRKRQKSRTLLRRP